VRRFARVYLKAQKAIERHEAAKCDGAELKSDSAPAPATSVPGGDAKAGAFAIVVNGDPERPSGGDLDVSVSAAEIDSFEIESYYFMLASHIMWALWAVIQAYNSAIPFGYLEYGRDRMAEYRRIKAALLSDAIDTLSATTSVATAAVGHSAESHTHDR
jgi:hypothetical protein